jgi:PAS domain S-box-containing protein
MCVITGRFLRLEHHMLQDAGSLGPSEYFMQSHPSEFQRHQLDVIARVTPHAMAGHILNTSVLAVALAGSIPTGELAIWCTCSYTVALLILFRHMRNRGRAPRSFQRAAVRATAYAFLLALPWSSMAVLHLGALAQDQELILVALGVGMAASGAILLSAVPAAAFCYMTGVLFPGAVKCLVFLDQGSYRLLGVLTVSYWWFLAALIAKITREINERKQADVALRESEVRLREALIAGRVVAFTWDPLVRRSQRSANAAQVLGVASDEGHGRAGDFLARVHPDDRPSYTAQIKGLSPKSPCYSASFRFFGPEGREVWLEETAKAEFDAAGRYVRLEGLTRDISELKRSEERLRQLVHELDHRVKNVLASVATVAQRTGAGSTSLDEFLRSFEGRIQAMANAHALLSRTRWRGASLADLVHKELAPWVGTGSTRVEGPDVLLSPEATQPLSIVLHELVTNASKYGALRVPQGRVSVRWSLQRGGERPGMLLLEWIEAGGPPVVAQSQPGYGTRTIRNLIPYEIGGTVDLAFDVQGMRCWIEVPSKRIQEGREATDLFTVPASPQPSRPSEAQSL